MRNFVAHVILLIVVISAWFIAGVGVGRTLLPTPPVCLPEKAECDVSRRALEGCETVLNSIHDQLFLCERNEEFWKERYVTCEEER